MRGLVLGALLVATGLGACSEPARDALPLASRPAPNADGRCAEHGVLEEVCPKCHPRLAAIFRERGDWCAEHELPESFCPLCHPERGGRPDLDVTPEAPPLDGTRVFLRTAEAVRAAGIEVEAARAPGETSLELLATLALDPSRRYGVNARVEGVVEALLVEVGTTVTAGTPLVRLESAEVGARLARERTAEARLELAESTDTRLATLAEQGLAADKDRLAARLELEGARAEREAARAALAPLRIESEGENRTLLVAPADGTVLSFATSAGRRVEEGELLCELVDTSVLWAEIDVPEAELERVTPGLEVHLTLDALPGRIFALRLDHLAPEVDPRTRTVKARARLANPGLLRAGLFARARLVLAPSAARAEVPREALQVAEGVELVFVQLAPDRYEARRVRSGARRDGTVEILEGLEPGVMVATRGSFLLQTEVRKESIGAGCCEVE